MGSVVGNRPSGHDAGHQHLLVADDLPRWAAPWFSARPRLAGRDLAGLLSALP